MTEPSNLRDAAEVWDDCYRAFYYGHTLPAITYPIEADRAAVEAATIAKVVAWLRRDVLVLWSDVAADAIEAGEHLK